MSSTTKCSHSRRWGPRMIRLGPPRSRSLRRRPRRPPRSCSPPSHRRVRRHLSRLPRAPDHAAAGCRDARHSPGVRVPHRLRIPEHRHHGSVDRGRRRPLQRRTAHRRALPRHGEDERARERGRWPHLRHRVRDAPAHRLERPLPVPGERRNRWQHRHRDRRHAAAAESGLQMGMAVISSDAGHNGGQNPVFGLDPQARLDYGYQAVGTLTPMAKIARRRDVRTRAGPLLHHRRIERRTAHDGRSTRYADQYDGFLAIAPGFNLPKAAVAQIWGAQQWSTRGDHARPRYRASRPQERQLVAERDPRALRRSRRPRRRHGLQQRQVPERLLASRATCPPARRRATDHV